MKQFLFTILTGSFFITGAQAANFPEPLSLGDTATYGRGLQRTMRLLTESTAERRNTLRVLFYGQSITEQG